ncbi:hypothetical protein ANCCEY_08256 [Ancylostoma ceylanicum]|uniref:Nucleotide-diphospho-sugar transferase domain-containing protein n=1 Tax=Ancylostoma ceylanicum TaxID=53326 RepID=A0A0D6LYG8_9BILA|nr:hypothetical protein ANCCEY_08256 [Ancylostoma ceylanicum]
MFSVIKHGSPNRRNVCSAVSLRLIYLFAFLCLIALLIHLKRSRGQNMEEIEKQLTDIFPLDDENIPAQLQIDNYEVPLLSTLEPDIERVQTVTPLIAGEKNATHLKRKRLRFDPRILRTVHERLLLVSLSKDVCKEITEEAQQATCVEAAVKGYDDPADYATDTFDAIMLFRAHLSTLFAMRSVKVVMVEADATWFRNPQSIFANEFVNDGVGIVTPRNGGISMGAIRAMSPMVIRPTSTTWKFLRGLARRLERSSAQNDQAVYNVLCSSRYLEQRCGIFYYEDIADGIWLSILQTCSLQY